MTAFLLSIPEALAYLFLNFSLFGIDWTRFKKRIVTFIFLTSLFMNLLLLFKVPIELSVVANIVFNMLVFKKLFPFSWSVAALMSLSQSAVHTMVESMMIHVRDVTSPHYQEELLEYSVRELLITLGADFLLFAIGYYFYVKKITFLKWFTSRHTEYTNYVVVLMSMFVIQNLINLISIRNSNLETHFDDYFLVVSLISIGIMGITIFLLNSFGKRLELQTTEQTEGVYLRNIEELISSVRAQRHDYHNHLQVISGLVHRKEYEEVTGYLKELNIELQSQQALLHLDHAPVAALLQAKKEIAQVHHVTIKVEVVTSIPAIEMISFELVQVLGNLLDNAIEEEIKAPPGRRIIHVKIDRMLNSFLVFRVVNANSWIEENSTDKVFQEGYTTKEGHLGLGLLTVKRIVSKYQGHIEIESDRSCGTTFSIFIPFSEKKRFKEEKKCPTT